MPFEKDNSSEEEYDINDLELYKEQVKKFSNMDFENATLFTFQK